MLTRRFLEDWVPTALCVSIKYHNLLSSIVLVVSYLQQHYNKMEDNESCSKVLLSDHLLNFLKLYGIDFNYNKIGISVRNNGFYFIRKEKNFDNSMSRRVMLSLENPLDPNINIGKTASQFHKIVELFKNWYIKLTKTMKETDVSILHSLLPTKLS